MSAKFSDIIPPNKRTIRNVPLTISVADEPKHVKHATTQKHAKELMKIVDKEEKSNRSKTIWVVAFVFVLILAFIIISKFSTGTVSIVASNNPIPVQMNIRLSHNATSTNSADYDVVTMSVSDNIPESAIQNATGTAALGSKAKGTVILYNNFSSSAQILQKNTRLESPDGKIFFITDKVTIPGQTTSKGSTIAGTVLAKVVAQKEGSSYNIGTKDFTLPALKATPRYKTVYAKTKDSIDGGTNTNSRLVIDPGTLQNLQDSLLVNAKKQIDAQKSDDYLIVPGGTQSTLHINGTSTATLDVSTLLIKKSDLAVQIQTHNNLDINLSPDNIKNLLVGTADLNLSLPDGVKLNNMGADPVSIGLNGTTTISSDLSSDVITKELSGLNYDIAEKDLKNKIGVEAVNLEIWPWWVKNFPTNPNRITVKIENN
ncbi:MAG: hypothetical protein WCG97_00280 [bacterium]